jgi:hypothetical protein
MQEITKTSVKATIDGDVMLCGESCVPFPSVVCCVSFYALKKKKKKEKKRKEKEKEKEKKKKKKRKQKNNKNK